MEPELKTLGNRDEEVRNLDTSKGLIHHCKLAYHSPLEQVDTEKEQLQAKDHPILRHRQYSVALPTKRQYGRLTLRIITQ